MPTGAELIVRTLEDHDVSVCFGLPGVHNLALWEGLRESPIRLVGVRHEQAAVYAADGYARATGRLGVALTTTGPGAANTLGAVGEAWASRSPVLVIATDIPTTLRRPDVYRGALHETRDQAAMFAPVVASSHRVTSAKDVFDSTLDAIAGARHAQRPAYLEVATDLLRAQCAVPASNGGSDVDEDLLEPLRHARDLLAAAERPLIWVGRGGLGAAPRIDDLARRLCAPVLTTYGARGVLPPDHPCLVGLPPHVPPAGGLWDEADLVIAVGTDFDGMNTQNWAQPQPPALLAINPDPDDATKNYAADVVIPVLPHLDDTELSPRPGLDALRTRLDLLRAEATAALDPAARRFLAAFASALPDDAIVLADMCIPGYWIAGFHPFARPRKLQYPVGWGTLGYAFPAAMGAALAREGPVVSVSGDGGFLFACGELATVAQGRIPLTAVIVDDEGYGMLAYDQDLAGEPRHGVALRSPDFVALAQSFGVRAEAVDGLEDAFAAALAHHIADPEPSVLVSRGPSLTPPPTTSPNWYRRRSA